MAKSTTPARDEPSGRAAAVEALFALFRAGGYDGVSIGEIAAATGLGRSSLYHYFPGGKEEMAQAVVAYAREAIERLVLAPLARPGVPARRLTAMVDGAATLYQGRACVLASLLSGAPPQSPLGRALADAFLAWRDATARVVRELGVSDAAARERASAAIGAMQGGLVLARALNDPREADRAFARAKAILTASA